jgi:xanthine/CO dehydrogenase XdhC/CoxF family maturation factor
VTPAEIGISIVAELVAVRRGVDTSPLAMSSRRKNARRAPSQSPS